MRKPERGNENGYLTVGAACELAAISRSTFYRLLDNPETGLGEVAIRIPGLNRIRLPRSRFCEWLESGRVGSGQAGQLASGATGARLKAGESR
jgi:excisionase family DNA binding protein